MLFYSINNFAIKSVMRASGLFLLKSYKKVGIASHFPSVEKERMQSYSSFLVDTVLPATQNMNVNLKRVTLKETWSKRNGGMMIQMNF